MVSCFESMGVFLIPLKEGPIMGEDVMSEMVVFRAGPIDQPCIRIIKLK